MAYNAKTNWSFGDTVTETDLNRIEQGIKTIDIDKAGYSDLYALQNQVAVDGDVRAATTVNITLSGLQTVDGVALAAGDRVLVKGQTNGIQNGIYTVSTGNWPRAADADSTAKITAGINVYVREGVTAGGKCYVMGNSGTITLDTTVISFVQLNSDKAPITSPSFNGVASFTGQISSSVATGTPPFVISSSSQVANLNASYLAGRTFNENSTGTTLASRDNLGDLTSRRFISSASNGTAPLVVTSSTTVSNLNADLLDGKHASEFVYQPAVINNGTNLNDLLLPGLYYCPANASVATLANSPTAMAFSLFVEKHAGSKQTLTAYPADSTARTWFRNYYSGTWSAWTRVWTGNDLTVSNWAPAYPNVGDIWIDTST